jgi:DHA1 family tetracycline resistance protein-like MFS transporter
MKLNKDKAVTTLLFVVFADAISFAMIMPILPFRVLTSGGGPRTGGELISVHALGTLIAAPLLGRLSDRYGRYRILLWTNAGAFLAHAFLGFSTNVLALFIARAAAGLMAGNISVVLATIADRTPRSSRAGNMGLVMTAWAIGVVIGPGIGLLGIYLSPGSAGMMVGLQAAAFSLICISLVFHSLRNLALRSETASLSPASGFFSAARGKGWLLLQSLLVSVCQSALVSMLAFWVHDTFGWGGKQVSILMIWVAVIIAAVQALCVAPLARVLGNFGAIIAGTATSALCSGAMILLLGSSAALIALAPLIVCGLTLVMTLLNTIMSNLSSADEQGASLGALSSSSGLGRVIGPTCGGLMLHTYGARGLLLLSILLCLCVCCWSVLKARNHTDQGSLNAVLAPNHSSSSL